MQHGTQTMTDETPKQDDAFQKNIEKLIDAPEKDINLTLRDFLGTPLGYSKTETAKTIADLALEERSAVQIVEIGEPIKGQGKIIKDLIKSVESIPSQKPSISKMESSILLTANHSEETSAADLMRQNFPQDVLDRMSETITIEPLTNAQLSNIVNLHFASGKQYLDQETSIHNDPTYGPLIDAIDAGAILKGNTSLRRFFKAADEGQLTEAQDMLQKPDITKPSAPQRNQL